MTSLAIMGAGWPYLGALVVVIGGTLLSLSVYVGRNNLNWSATRVGTWVWGGVMIWIFVCVLYTIVWGALHIDVVTAAIDAYKDADKTNPPLDFVCSLYVAIQQNGSLVGVALGFVSLAWVNFFTSKGGDDERAPTSVDATIEDLQRTALRFRRMVETLGAPKDCASRLENAIQKANEATKELKQAVANSPKESKN